MSDFLHGIPCRDGEWTRHPRSRYWYRNTGLLCELIPVIAGGTNVFAATQRAYRFYEDGTESGSVAIDSENTNITRLVSTNSNLQLRIGLQESGSGSASGASTDDYQLQYSKNGGAFTNITAASTNVSGFLSANLTEGDATTNRLSNGTGSFVAGKVSEDGLVDNWALTANNYSELLYSIELKSADLAEGNTLDFRVLRNGAVITYSVTPRITATKIAASVGSADGIGTASGIGVALTAASASAAGTSTVDGVATAIKSAAGSAAGVGAASAIRAAAELTVELREGGTLIKQATLTADASGAFVTDTITLTTEERDAITDWADLEIWLIANKGQIDVSWVELSTPAAAPAQDSGAGSADGLSTVSGVGASIVAAAGSSAGTSTVGAVGRSTVAAVAASSGSGAVSGIGASIVSAVASAKGVGAVSSPYTAFTDDFNRADGELGANFDPYPVGSLVIVGNRLRRNPDSEIQGVESYSGALPDDQWASLTWVENASEGEIRLGVILRASDPAVSSAFYLFEGALNTTFTGRITYYNGGEVESVEENATSWAIGDVVTGRVIGTSLKLYKNGVEILSWTHDALTSGRSGVSLYTSDPPSPNFEADNFETGGFSAVGAKITASAGSSSGAGDATAAGQSIAASAAASSGVGDATGIGASTADAVGTASGTGDAAGAGAAIVEGVGSSAGVSTADAAGSAIASGVGSSAGTSTADAAGQIIGQNIGSAAGVGAATGVGASIAASAGSSSGLGDATAVATSIVAGVGNAAGTSTADAAVISTVAAVGAADGVATANSVGQSTAASVGASSGAGAATGASQAEGAAVGSADGLADVAAVGASIVAAVGNASGNATAAAAATAIIAAAGSASGSGDGSGTGASTSASAGASAGSGTGVGVGSAIAEAAGVSAGLATVNAVGTEAGFSAGIGSSAGVGTAQAVGAIKAILFTKLGTVTIIPLGRTGTVTITPVSRVDATIEAESDLDEVLIEQ